MLIPVIVLSMIALLATKSKALDEPVATGCQALTTKPDVHVRTYNLSNCLVLKVGAYYKTDKNEFVNFDNGVINLNESNCNTAGSESNLRINFECGHLKFIINSKVGEKKLTSVRVISGSYQIGENVTAFSSSTAHLFNITQPEHYYKCDSEQTILLSNNGSLKLSKFAYEVDRNSSDVAFYKIPEVCISYEGWPIFSLVVGLGMLMLVVMLIRCLIRKMKG